VKPAFDITVCMEQFAGLVLGRLWQRHAEPATEIEDWQPAATWRAAR